MRNLTKKMGLHSKKTASSKILLNASIDEKNQKSALLSQDNTILKNLAGIRYRNVSARPLKAWCYNTVSSILFF